MAGLIDAINMANGTAGSNRIILEAGVYTLRDVNNNTDGPNGLPSITNVLTISSSGGTAIIERAADAPSFRILHVGFSALALFNVTIRGGSADTGGGLFNRGRITFLFSSTVSGNSAGQGGGIFNSGGFLPGELVLVDSTIDRNRASGGGGGILNEGGLSISNSTISMNENGTGGGGGIINSNVGTLTITNSTISGNTSGAGGGTGGGGIYNLTGSTVTITNSTISGNSIPSGNGRGGGINNGGTLNLNNVTITNNTAEIEGGGINNFGTVNLKNTIIAGNVDTANSTTASQSPDCEGTLMSQGFNLIGTTGFVPGTMDPRPPACVIVPPARLETRWAPNPVVLSPGLPLWLWIPLASPERRLTHRSLAAQCLMPGVPPSPAAGVLPVKPLTNASFAGRSMGMRTVQPSATSGPLSLALSLERHLFKTGCLRLLPMREHGIPTFPRIGLPRTSAACRRCVSMVMTRRELGEICTRSSDGTCRLSPQAVR